MVRYERHGVTATQVEVSGPQNGIGVGHGWRRSQRNRRRQLLDFRGQVGYPASEGRYFLPNIDQQRHDRLLSGHVVFVHLYDRLFAHFLVLFIEEPQNNRVLLHDAFCVREITFNGQTLFENR